MGQGTDRDPPVAGRGLGLAESEGVEAGQVGAGDVKKIRKRSTRIRNRSDLDQEKVETGSEGSKISETDQLKDLKRSKTVERGQEGSKEVRSRGSKKGSKRRDCKKDKKKV